MVKKKKTKSSVAPDASSVPQTASETGCGGAVVGEGVTTSTTPPTNEVIPQANTKESKISPYASSPVTIDVGPGSATYIMPKHFLKTSIWSDTEDGGKVVLHGVSSDTGHTLVHYLYTGTYEAFGKKSEFDQALLAFVLASTYDLDGLKLLAMEQIRICGENMTLCEVLDKVKKDFSKLHKSSLLHAYLEGRSSKQFFDGFTVFTSENFADSLGKGSLCRYMMRHVLQLFSEHYSNLLEAHKAEIWKNLKQNDELVEDFQPSSCALTSKDPQACPRGAEMVFDFPDAVGGVPTCTNDVLSLEDSSIPDCSIPDDSSEEVICDETIAISEDHGDTIPDPIEPPSASKTLGGFAACDRTEPKAVPAELEVEPSPQPEPETIPGPEPEAPIEVDPFAGLSKAQKKKLEKRMKEQLREEAKKQEELEAIAAKEAELMFEKDRKQKEIAELQRLEEQIAERQVIEAEEAARLAIEEEDARLAIEAEAEAEAARLAIEEEQAAATARAERLERQQALRSLPETANPTSSWGSWGSPWSSRPTSNWASFAPPPVAEPEESAPVSKKGKKWKKKKKNRSENVKEVAEEISPPTPPHAESKPEPVPVMEPEPTFAPPQAPVFDEPVVHAEVECEPTEEAIAYEEVIECVPAEEVATEEAATDEPPTCEEPTECTSAETAAAEEPELYGRHCEEPVEDCPAQNEPPPPEPEPVVEEADPDVPKPVDTEPQDEHYCLLRGYHMATGGWKHCDRCSSVLAKMATQWLLEKGV